MRLCYCSVVMMLLVHLVAAVGRLTFGFAAADQFVMFHLAPSLIAVHCRVGMNVHPPIHPGSLPARVVDEEFVVIPINPARAPSPRTEPRANGNAETEPDGGAYHESGAWRRKHD